MSASSTIAGVRVGRDALKRAEERAERIARSAPAIRHLASVKRGSAVPSRIHRRTAICRYVRVRPILGTSVDRWARVGHGFGVGLIRGARIDISPGIQDAGTTSVDIMPPVFDVACISFCRGTGITNGSVGRTFERRMDGGTGGQPDGGEARS